MHFICYPGCSTCRKAQKWLEENNIGFDFRNIKEEKPSASELAAWLEKSGVSIKKLFNTSGLLYKELKLKERLPGMSEEEQFELLASDGMLVKRPILVGDDFVLIGFKQPDWEKAIIG